MKKFGKFLFNFAITTLFCYLIIPVVAMIIATIIIYICYGSLDVEKLTETFLHVINPNNFIITRISLLVSMVIGLTYAFKNKNIFQP